MTLIERITTHVIEDGECWNWTGALQTCGATPVMRWQGKAPQAVRRLILLERGPAPKGKPLASYACGNPMCVHPDHTAWVSRKAVQQRTTREQGHQRDALRCKKLADSARQRAKLTLELAQQVHEAQGAQHEIAARFGVSQATVSAIKTGKTWRSYTNNPFAGLGARP
jgi:predicted XRE-type DNA-binding protein